MKSCLYVFIFIGHILGLPAYAANGAQTLSCLTDEDQSLSIQIADLGNCDDLKANTVCTINENHDSFQAYAVERSLLANAKSGDQIEVSALEGYIHKEWLVKSDRSLNCVVK